MKLNKFAILFIFLLLGDPFLVMAQDNVPPSQVNPGNFQVSDIPMFVALGNDDNGRTDGINWIIDYMATKTNPPGNGNAGTFDGEPATMSFFNNSRHIEALVFEPPADVKKAWRKAFDSGHEMGNHTHSHPHGSSFTQQDWYDEMLSVFQWCAKPLDPNETLPEEDRGIGLDFNDIIGFRAPFLEYNDNTFKAEVHPDLGFVYDCSIEEGWECGDPGFPKQDGTDYYWPYTLNNNSPGHQQLVAWGSKDPIDDYPGLWEMPVYCFIIPPDDKCVEYGIEVGLRSRIQTNISWFDTVDGKITGFDYNLWYYWDEQDQTDKPLLSPAEVLGTLKYSFDLRISTEPEKEGNRAPFLLGFHSDQYSGAPEKQAVFEDFIDYVLTYDFVRVVSYKKVLDWCRNPTQLSSSTPTPKSSRWTGATNTVWNLEENWRKASIPDSLTDVRIHQGTNQPTIRSTAECNGLSVENGGTLSIEDDVLTIE